MELPQSRTQDRKAIHDFLTLYSSPAKAHVQQDPTHSQVFYGIGKTEKESILWCLFGIGCGEGKRATTHEWRIDYLKTHDFLKPLERVEKKGHSTNNKAAAERSDGERPQAEEVSYFNQRLLEAEGGIYSTQAAASNYTSHMGKSGFTLWNESSGKTGKENIASHTHIMQDADVNVEGGQWTSLLENPSQSSSSYKHNTTTFTSFSSSQPSTSQKNQCFMEMITSAKKNHEEEEEEDDDDVGDEFVIKKEASPHPKGLLLLLKMREIIPNSDQKRDKASFLLEVNRYESSYCNGWNHEPSKMMHLNMLFTVIHLWLQQNNSHIAKGVLDQTESGNTDSSGAAAVFGRKLGGDRACRPTSLPINGRNLVNSDRVLTSKAAQANIFTFAKTSMAVASPISPTPQLSDTDRTMTWTTAFHKTKDEELAVEKGTIKISSMYSQGLLNTLAQALQTSGVDISQASISVQIELGKRANCIQQASTPDKDDNVPASAGVNFLLERWDGTDSLDRKCYLHRALLGS
ncbi:basic helix-loop-helix (bHLH) DNA-bindingsuperfamily protein [Striga asiatica]|uniref:Basic helix-loop-helix (BHLH) DNA-bindingsuperfamily protein n=1 Tax=Striga asiatica TaxID=4170 RepID=A0A5A7QKV7_STRAF|nr:basic helix-loop-helix (bHLH) DNA-bindingsuperfamily protein [Striga asiatica]